MRAVLLEAVLLIALADFLIWDRLEGRRCEKSFSVCFFLLGLQEIEWVILGDHSGGSMQERTLRRRYSSSRSPYARLWKTRILLLRPSTNPSETLFSGLQ